jgi:hypothetical protein
MGAKNSGEKVGGDRKSAHFFKNQQNGKSKKKTQNGIKKPAHF